MAPKAKVKAKAKGKAKMAPMRALRKAKARVLRPAGGRGKARPVRHRPAAGPQVALTRDEALRLWTSGHTLSLRDVPLEELMKDPEIVLEDARYFHKEGKLAGRIIGVANQHPHLYLRVSPTGTTHEEVLRIQSGSPSLVLRVHVCPQGCAMEEVAEDLLHGVRVRKQKHITVEEPWTMNLEKAAPAEVPDELEQLRGHMAGGTPAVAKEKEGSDHEKKTKDKKKDKKDKRNKKKAKPDPAKKGKEGSTGSEAAALDGSRPRVAAQKTLKAVFGGTGLDPRDKVRRRVQKVARKVARRRGDKSSSSPTSKSESSDSDQNDVDEHLFDKDSRVKVVADRCPGALAGQALAQMRSSLMQSWGFDDQADGSHSTALQYFRQVLQPKTQGPILREQLTLTAIMDAVGRGRPAVGMDIAAQRLKSLEAVAAGTHWTVARRLEITPVENQLLAGEGELRGAQKDSWQEARTHYLASNPDGRSSGKGQGKTKGGGKDDTRKGDKKGGKGGGQRNEPWKKKEDGTTKTG